MLSYVILVAIVISLSITVFSWLKIIANVEPVASCDEGVSIIIQDYECNVNIFNLTIKNNGRFSVDGFIMTAGDNTERAPIVRLLPFDPDRLSTEGYFVFETPLKPNEINETLFTNTEISGEGTNQDVFDFIRNVRIQPFVIDDESKEKIVCSEAIIKQNIVDCEIGG